MLSHKSCEFSDLTCDVQGAQDLPQQFWQTGWFPQTCRVRLISISATHPPARIEQFALTIIIIIRIDSVFDMHQPGTVQILVAKDTVVGISEILEGVDLDRDGTKPQVTGVHTSFSTSVAMWLDLLGTHNVTVPTVAC